MSTVDKTESAPKQAGEWLERPTKATKEFRETVRVV